MPPLVVVKKERKVRIDAELWHTSECLLKAGEEHELGSTHQFRASLIFTVFSFEAYLNHIGPSIFASWSEIEKKLSPQEKLSLLCERLVISPDWACRPWQSIKALVRFRNAIAHGRGEQLAEIHKESVQNYQRSLYEMPLAEWEKYGSQENAQRAREDVLQVAELLQAKTGNFEHLPFFFGMQSGTASYVAET